MLFLLAASVISSGGSSDEPGGAAAVGVVQRVAFSQIQRIIAAQATGTPAEVTAAGTAPRLTLIYHYLPTYLIGDSAAAGGGNRAQAALPC